MSYPPRTLLSHHSGGQRATVVTDGNVIVTEGVCRGRVIKLVDWLILANETKVVVVWSPPVPKETLSIKLPGDSCVVKVPLATSLSSPDILCAPEIELLE